jgi:hypothetical protein
VYTGFCVTPALASTVLPFFMPPWCPVLHQIINRTCRGTIHSSPFAITTVVSLFSPTHILAIANVFYTQISETFSIFTVVELASPGPLDVASSAPLSPEPIGLRTYCGSGAISSSGANWVPLHALGRQLFVCGPSGSVSLRLYGLVQAFGRVGWGIIFFRIYNANRDRTIIEPLSSVSRGIREWRGVPACSRITIFAASECQSAVSPYCHIAVSPNCHIAVSPYCHIASPTVPSSYCIAHSVIAISYRHGAATSTFATRRRCHRQSIWRSRGDGLYGAAAPPWVLLMYSTVKNLFTGEPVSTDRYQRIPHCTDSEQKDTSDTMSSQSSTSLVASAPRSKVVVETIERYATEIAQRDGVISADDINRLYREFGRTELRSTIKV